MLDPSSSLEYFADQKSFEEVYEVVKTAIIVHNDGTYRIEVLKSFWNSNIPYTTSSYRDELIDGKHVWVWYHAPWTRRDTADEALGQALGFLARSGSQETTT